MVKVLTEFPYKVRVIENLFIPLADGTKLAAKVWLPEGAGAVPAIMEYLPYRKRDGTRTRDNGMHMYLAGHGYACLRVDIRGMGDSEGVLLHTNESHSIRFLVPTQFIMMKSLRYDPANPDTYELRVE